MADEMEIEDIQNYLVTVSHVPDELTVGTLVQDGRGKVVRVVYIDRENREIGYLPLGK